MKVIRVLYGSMGLDEVHKEMKKQHKDKVAFWRPIYKELPFKGLVPGVKYHADKRNFAQVIMEFEVGYRHYFPPIGDSYEKAGRQLANAIAKKLGCRLVEVKL
jgi:hypothetical protein